MDPTPIYRAKLTTPAEAVGRIASGVNLSTGMAMTEPPALLKALADRTATGKVDDLMRDIDTQMIKEYSHVFHQESIERIARRHG
jgi:acyl-CoA hydrolase